jgi:lipoprotein NlpI
MQQMSFWKQGLLFAAFLFCVAIVMSSNLHADNPAPAPAPLPAPGPGSDANSYVKYGMSNGAHGDIAGAITAFDEAIKIDPKFAPAYFNRGFAESLQHQGAEAIADYTQAIALDPNYKEAYYQRGSIEGQAAHFEDAARDFSAVIKIDPKYAPAHYNLGHVDYFQGNLDGAMSEVNLALSLNPRFPYSYFIRGLIQHAQGERSKALSDFRDSAGLGFAYGSIWTYVAEMEDNQPDQAKTDLSDALTKTHAFQPDDWPSQIANFLLGKMSSDQLLAKAKLGDPSSAQSRLCEAWFYVGESRRLAGDAAGAKDAFAKSTATGSKGSEEFVESNRELAH